MKTFPFSHSFKISLLLAALAGIASTASAQIQRFADDFVQPNTEWFAGWNERVGNWRIVSNELRPQDVEETGSQVANQLVTHDAITLDHPFRVRADMWSRSGSRWAGVAFHAQDHLNMYVFRIRFSDSEPRYQLLRFVNGGTSGGVLANEPLATTGSMLDPIGRRYRVQVSSEAAGEFTLQVFEEQEGEWGEILNTVVTDSTYSGGVAGAYANADRAVFNNFLLEVGEAEHPDPESARYVDEFDGEELAAEWNQLNGDWSIVDSSLRPADGGWPPNAVIAYEGITLEQPFETSTTMWSRSGSRWGGPAFNIQSAGNFYTLRLRFSHDTNDAEVQFHRYENGNSTYFRRLHPAFEAADMLDPAARKYRLVVGGGEFGDLHFEVWEENPETGEFNRIYRNFVTDYAFSGGHAGVYAASDRIVASRFEVSVGDLPAEDHPFEIWQRANFTAAELADPQISGPEASPAGDGLSNLVKYALGLDPWEPSRDAAPRIQWDLDGPALVFTAPEERPGIELLLGVSTDLVEWEEVLLNDNYAGWGSVSTGDGREEITVTPPPPADGDRLFLRLGVRLVE